MFGTAAQELPLGALAQSLRSGGSSTPNPEKTKIAATGALLRAASAAPAPPVARANACGRSSRFPFWADHPQNRRCADICKKARQALQNPRGLAIVIAV